MRRSIVALILLFIFLAPKSAWGAANWNWQDYSNSSLISESGDYSLPWYWWFSKRPAGKAYLLMNHKPGTWVSTTSGCAFVPNGTAGKRYTATKNKVSYEYFVYTKVTLVAPVSVPGGSVVAQTKGPQITGGVSLCGVRYFPPGVPIKVTLP